MSTQESASPVAQKRFRWIYILPVIHLAVCLVVVVAYLSPSYAFLGFSFIFLMLVDFPFSVVAFFLTFSGHGFVALGWSVFAGTLWWYYLGRKMEKFINPKNARYQTGDPTV
jgi:hypothetical protein